MDTNCHLCKAPMTIDMEPNEFFPAAKIHAIATCAECCRRRGDRRPKSELINPNKPKDTTSLPYADN